MALAVATRGPAVMVGAAVETTRIERRPLRQTNGRRSRSLTYVAADGASEMLAALAILACAAAEPRHPVHNRIHLLIGYSPFMRRLARFGLATVAALVCPALVKAQDTAAPPFATMLVARLDRLAADSAVRARTGAKNGMALFAAVPPDAIGRVSDTDLVRVLGLVVHGLGTVDAATCALAYGRAGTDGMPQAFVAIATRLDSVEAVPWVDAFVPVFQAGLAGRPLGARAPEPEARQALANVFAELTPSDRERIQRAAARTGSPEDVCYFVRTTFAALLALPGGRAAPIFRALMFGPGT